MRVLTPATLDEALVMLAEGAATPAAGCTDLFVSWPHHDHTSLTMLDLSRLDELRRHELTDDALTLGALTTYWDIITDAESGDAFPLLVEAARLVGAVQIQTRGTWAGNIGNGSPAADGVPVLMAYDARVTLQSAQGIREVPLDQYYTGYRQSVRRHEELIVDIRVPRRPRTLEWFHKVGARSAQAITKVGVAMVCSPDGWRVVANSVAPQVVRCTHMEEALDAGRTFGSSNEVRALIDQDVAPIDDLRSTAEYRREVLSRLIYHRLGHPSGA